jgi:hypothetical protein
VQLKITLLKRKKERKGVTKKRKRKEKSMIRKQDKSAI